MMHSRKVSLTSHVVARAIWPAGPFHYLLHCLSNAVRQAGRRCRQEPAEHVPSSSSRSAPISSSHKGGVCCRRMMAALLARQGAGRRARITAVAAWLFNPFTATISTRGSGEAVPVVQLLALLLALDAGEPSVSLSTECVIRNCKTHGRHHCRQQHASNTHLQALVCQEVQLSSPKLRLLMFAHASSWSVATAMENAASSSQFWVSRQEMVDANGC